jgi:hypothetical protein
MKFKKYAAENGIELDFRKHQYCENGHNLTPFYNYSFGEEIAVLLCVYFSPTHHLNKYHLIEKMRTTKLKQIIDCFEIEAKNQERQKQ